ncbi:MAG: aminotransferase class III-fold pyridoxal phosphate-dependent enzyme [Gemmatimonadota bacterium]
MGLRADLICLGKALGGGLPLSACLGRREIMDAWPPSEGEALHTSTFLGHPLACAAGLAVLDALETEAVPERARLLGSRLVNELRERLRGVGAVADVRGLGLMIGIELVGRKGREPLAGGAVRVARAALQEGLLVLPGGEVGHVVTLSPTVALTEAQVTFVLDVLPRCIRQATE